MSQAGTVRLRKTKARRVQAGHPWIFSNEIATVEGGPQAGEIVSVYLAGGEPLGRGFYHPHSLIAVRLLTRDLGEPVGEALFSRRLTAALDYRSHLYPGSSVYRLVHGEGDFLPGLVVDRYGDCLVLQFYSAGMDRLRDCLVAALVELLEPRAIVERSDSPLRELEGLEPRSGVLHGEEPGPLEVEEEGVRLGVDVMAGQKTGAFLDQRENRLSVRRVARGARVVDAFCHEGWFALQAAAGGASEVLGLDVSPASLARAKDNAARNDLGSRVRFEAVDAMDRLRSLPASGSDLVVLDPPSFARTRKHVPQARRAYRKLHRAALRLIREGGFLATSCCSHHVREDTFFDTVARAAQDSDRRLRWIARGAQPPDHPVLVGVPETAYLKFGLFQVL